MFSIAVASFYILNNAQGFQFLYVLSNNYFPGFSFCFVCFCLLYIFTKSYLFLVYFVLFLLSYKSNPNGCEMVCHYSLDSHL